MIIILDLYQIICYQVFRWNTINSYTIIWSHLFILLSQMVSCILLIQKTIRSHVGSNSSFWPNQILPFCVRVCLVAKGVSVGILAKQKTSFVELGNQIWNMFSQNQQSLVSTSNSGWRHFFYISQMVRCGFKIQTKIPRVFLIFFFFFEKKWINNTSILNLSRYVGKSLCLLFF